MNIKTKDGADAYDALNKKINANDEFVKNNSSSQEKLKLNIGGYKGQIKAAFEDITSGNISSGFKSLGSSITGAVKEMASFVLSPIGAVITAIGVVLIPLVTYFKNFTPFIDKVNQGLSYLSSGFEALQGVVVEFYTNIKDLGDFFYKIGDIVSHPIDSFKNLGKTITEAGNAGAKLKKDIQDLEDAQEVAEVSTQRLEAQMNKLIVASKNRTLSEKERTSLLKEASIIDFQIFNTRKKLADNEIRIAQESIKQSLINSGLKGKVLNDEMAILSKNGISEAKILQDQDKFKAKITDDQIDRLKKAELSQVAILNESTKRQETINNRLDLLAQKKEEKDKKRREDTIKEGKTISELITKIEKEKADEAIKTAQIELDTYLKKNKSLLDSDKFFSDESLANEILRLQNISTEREKFAKLQLDKYAITQSEYNATILAIDEDFNSQKLENENKRSEAKIAQKAADDQLLFEIEQLSYDDEFQAQSAQLDRQKQAEIDNAKSTGASIDLINKKYALMEVELDKQKNAAKLEGYKGLFGGLANLLGQNTELGKAAAIAETTISTYQSAVAAYASAAKIDPIFLAPTMAALAIATGLANVAKIAETPTPKIEGFADGGRIDLPKMINRSNGDDVIITAKNGEVILNERQQQSIGYGSLALAGVPGFANGGAIGISSSASNSIRRSTSSSSDIVTAIADKINNQQVVAVVDDINLAQFKRVSVVERALI